MESGCFCKEFGGKLKGVVSWRSICEVDCLDTVLASSNLYFKQSISGSVHFCLQAFRLVLSAVYFILTSLVPEAICAPLCTNLWRGSRRQVSGHLINRKLNLSLIQSNQKSLSYSISYFEETMALMCK